PLAAQPQEQSSAVVAQRIVKALYAARLTLASQTVVTVNVDGTVTTFTRAQDIDAAIDYWERKAALLSGRRRRTQSVRLDRW
ncbi:MAG TPA: hypothetical protein VN541_11870, partial [Tepidisphaeraceae bacterium]|nr:hypothetical protein [Tepidisphaeraceae bacterium]